MSEFSYEWLREGIPAATGVSYKITTADEGFSLWCVVTATNGSGGSTVESWNSIEVPGPPPEPPVEKSAPVASGTAAVGETIGCATGSWGGRPAPTFAYQWMRRAGSQETSIAAASASSYLVTEADRGDSLACKVTATNSAGSVSKLSNWLEWVGTKPKDGARPTVAGNESPGIGEALTCLKGEWSGKPAPTYAYQWLRDGAVIASATGPVHIVERADQLKALSCAVTATNSEGSTSERSSNQIEVPGEAPANTAPPEVSPMEPAVGDTLTCEKGTWTGVPTPTYAYLWVRDQAMPGEVAIDSATSRTYRVTSEDRGHSLSCDVTATNSEGQLTRSASVVVPERCTGCSPPQNKALPEVAGVPWAGEALACSTGAWNGNPAPSFSYQWRRDGAIIDSATGPSHTIELADEGHALSCEVIAKNGEGYAAADSAAVQVPGSPPLDRVAPEVVGTPARGEPLSCLKGEWSGEPPPTFTYRWLRDGSAIPGATQSSYAVALADEGHSMSCAVIATNSQQSTEAGAANSLEIPGPGPANVEKPGLSGSLTVGSVLTCSPGAWTGDPTEYTYQWLLSGVTLTSATASTYSVASADRGLALACEVTARNREGYGSAMSASVHIKGLPPVDTLAPRLAGALLAGEALTCKPGEWSGEPPPAFSYRWVRDRGLPAEATIASASGETYVMTFADEGHTLSCDVTATNSEGSAEAQSNVLEIPSPPARAEHRPEPALPPGGGPTSLPTAEQIITALRVQLARMQHRVRIATLRKQGLYAFSFAAPAAGKLKLRWYAIPAGANHSSNTKPSTLALSTMSFSAAGTKTVRLVLTAAGRRLISQSKRITLTVEGMFVGPSGPLIWRGTFVLDH